MKKIIFMAIAMFSMLSYSCKEEKIIDPISETEGLKMVQSISNDTNIVELYTKSGALRVGYNEVFLRVKNISTGTFAEDAVIDWSPVMHMISMTHSCPKSLIAKVAGKESLYKGYIVFQMPENPSERWTLAVNGMTAGASFSVKDTVAVPNTLRKRVTTFKGPDEKKYILALIEPSTPSVAINDMTVGIFTMQNMMSFPVVKDYSVLIDPRMPSMANHGSPNNVDLSYSATDSLYHGKLSLTMTGYWNINMILKNAANEIFQGEPVTIDHESSTLFLELEF